MMRGTLEHPKFLDLQARLDVPRYRAAGLLECAWHFTAKYAPDGAVGRWPNSALARALEWDGDSDELVEALVGAGWLDRSESCRLYVHDWSTHADDAVHMALARATRLFANGDMPRLRRFGATEKAAIEAAYAHACAHAVRTPCAHDAAARAHAVLTSPPENRTAPPGPKKKTRRAAPRRSDGPKQETIGQAAVGAFCDEYEAVRKVKPAINGKDAKALKELAEQIGVERLRAAAVVYMGLDEPRVRDASYCAAMFVALITKCDVTAQNLARNAPLEATEAGERERREAERAVLTPEERATDAALFGGPRAVIGGGRG